MYSLTYRRPKTLGEAQSLFKEAEQAAYLSGGHTLIPTMKARLAAPDRLIDLRGIPELRGIEAADNRISIGACTTHFEVSTSPLVRSAIPALAGLAGSIGDAQVRYVGTMGGSVANNDPSADYPSGVLALGATVVTDRRRLAAGDFFTGLYETALEESEILVRIEFPVPLICGYAKLRNNASRYALAGVFVARHGDGSVRAAVTGAGSNGVFRAHEVENALTADFRPEALDRIAASSAGLMSEFHASAEYRAHLIVVLARRAVAHPGSAQIMA
jgi:carbon-monoxide dehydrogenase medium subunit